MISEPLYTWGVRTVVWEAYWWDFVPSAVYSINYFILFLGEIVLCFIFPYFFYWIYSFYGITFTQTLLWFLMAQFSPWYPLSFILYLEIFSSFFGYQYVLTWASTLNIWFDSHPFLGLITINLINSLKFVCTDQIDEIFYFESI